MRSVEYVENVCLIHTADVDATKLDSFVARSAMRFRLLSKSRSYRVRSEAVWNSISANVVIDYNELDFNGHACVSAPKIL